MSLPIITRADDDDSEDYDVKARVARISLMAGEVSLQRLGNKDWEPTRLNYPLVEGDKLATGKGSLLEIQIDARNFVRLASSSVLRIVTLRDEGIALSVIEGTVTIRLAKFDRKNEYFELDAPKTTMAAEKEGFYRIDVPREGRVRLTVRDGGTARIYSDTSGFTLRDGRAAELVDSGENAGDWEFLAAAPPDAVDDWVKQREGYLAQRLNEDVKYFDEYVWGAEDLDDYGDWIATHDYGWIWRPRSGAIATYSDWAPYRYGYWTWCPPYGWTWVGYEPWGWAPYHYGRWVYYNGYWAWCPRSTFYRKRSWWRPALVAFVFDFSFGNDICWYPLSYYQRDPHSRHYRHNDYYPRPGYSGGGGSGGGGRPYEHRDRDDKPWRGVTRVPRTDFGSPYRRGHAVEEPVARRVVASNPETGDPPRRDPIAVNAPVREGDREAGAGRSRLPVLDIPDRRTGAADREPGATLDDDLRRSRVFRGREPRAPQASPQVQQPPQSGAAAPPVTTDTQPQPAPTGAVNRPEPRPSDQPREDRPGRSVRPTMPDGVEKRTRGREGIENTPRNAPEPRNEQPAPASQPQPRESRPEPPRSEPPRSESPRSESPRPEPRSEPRESRPSRSETPRYEAPRSEAPRSEPRHESPRSESPRSESPRSESPRSESPRSESPRSEPPRSESPRSETPRESPKPDKPDRPML